MMLDYVEIALPLPKDKINFTYMDRYSYHPKSDISCYELKGNWSPMKITVNPRKDEVVLKGSIPFYYSGHNFSHSNQDFRNAIDSIEEKTSLNWLTGDLKKFEYGQILETSFSPAEIINSHLSIKGMETRPWKHGRYFSNSTLDVKLYNAKHRISKTCDRDIKKLIELEHGYNTKSNYIKFENRYNNPSNHFLRQIKAIQLYQEPIQTLLKEDLILTYTSIIKSHKVGLPEKASAGELCVAIIQDLCFISGIDPHEYIQVFTKSQPVKNVLTSSDRKNRNRTLKAWGKKISTLNNSEFDLTELLIKKLDEVM